MSGDSSRAFTRSWSAGFFAQTTYPDAQRKHPPSSQAVTSSGAIGHARHEEQPVARVESVNPLLATVGILFVARAARTRPNEGKY